MNKQQRDRNIQLGKFNESLSDEDNLKCCKYFNNESIIQKAFDIVKKGFDIKNPFGNYLSNIVFIIDFEDTKSDSLNLLKIMIDFRHEKNKNIKDFFSMYYTQCAKTSSEKINNKVLEIELGVIKPKSIVNVGTDYNVKDKKGITIYNIDKNVINNMIKGLNDSEYKQNEEYKKSRKVFIDTIDMVLIS